VYAKRHLHPDEEDYFVPGPNLAPIRWKQDVVALSICYELSVPEHARGAFGAGATAYVASVAKKRSNVQAARRRLREISREYAAPVCMVNTVGPCEGEKSPGLSAVWGRTGRLAAELPPDREGILCADVVSGELGSSTARELA
jgi:predicted amidohydrolase